jgi:transcriptional regulator with XRE-family HTH domain
MTPSDLRAWQTQLGYTYDTASAALGVSRSAYADWLAGTSRTTHKPITIDRRTALACAALALGVEPWADNQKSACSLRIAACPAIEVSLST